MKIVNKQVCIKTVSETSSKYIESELEKQNIKPLRWAIVAVNNGFYTVNVSCCEEYLI